MSMFKLISYTFTDGEAVFTYGDTEREYVERVHFSAGNGAYDPDILDKALFLAFLLVGTSYYKVSPIRDVVIKQGNLDDWQSAFCDKVYQEGMSQYAFENELTREELAHFAATTSDSQNPQPYNGAGILSLQSGGKDSLLLSTLLTANGAAYTPWYVTNGTEHPLVLDTLPTSLCVARRAIDVAALTSATESGGLSGHVPVTYILLSFALIQAILLGKNTIVAAIAHEGDEPHGWIGDLPVNHQWSKTWEAEQLLSEYVRRYISPDINVGSPLRSLSELKVAELFAGHTWSTYGGTFSSCNTANYQLGADNSTLTWCADCPKCANAYLLFAPFIAPAELQNTFGTDLYSKPSLQNTFKGLLNIDGVIKPFECIGEVEELRSAYHGSRANGYDALPFDVPTSTFDKDGTYESQAWATALINGETK